MREIERRLLLAVLTPILWLQSRRVRSVTPQLPEATGPRQGDFGVGPVLRVLLIGDSGAAGVGVELMSEALCGQLVGFLAQHYTVQWSVLAFNGLDSPGLIGHLELERPQRFDLVIISIGANDATGLCDPGKWLKLQDALASLIESRFKPRLLVHTAVPPMHACTALPQPLRWFMGRWAFDMNRKLGESIRQSRTSRAGTDCLRSMHWHPPITDAIGMSRDGIHPSAAGYSAWAKSLDHHITQQGALDS